MPSIAWDTVHRALLDQYYVLLGDDGQGMGRVDAPETEDDDPFPDEEEEPTEATRYFVDKELGRVFPEPCLAAWLALLDDELRGQAWTRADPVLASPRLTTFEEGGVWEYLPMAATAFTTARGDRLESWQLSPDTIDSWHRATDPAMVLLETASCHALVIGNVGCHPFVVCDLFGVCKSDGHTNRDEIHHVPDAPEELLRILMRSALHFAYHT